MFWRKEIERVGNATRAIRDLVVRPKGEPRTGAGEIGAGIESLLGLALAPLRFLPQAATRIPGLLRELGERRRAVPPEDRLSPDTTLAVQAIAGYLRSDGPLAHCFVSVLSASMDRRAAARVHPSFVQLLRQLAPDEARIVRLFDSEGPFPIVSVVSRFRFGGAIQTELRNFSTLGETAGCEQPERTPVYLDNLARLGIVELRAARVSEDTRTFAALETHPAVRAVIERIEARPAIHGPSGNERAVAEFQYKFLTVTALGRQFHDACTHAP